MACSEFSNILIQEETESNGAKDFSSENDFSTKCFDDLQMIRVRQKAAARDMKLSNNPNLNYLNLLDYENKKGVFLSSICGFPQVESVLRRSNSLEKAFETLGEYTSASIFCLYVNYLKNIPKKSVDLQAFEKKIYHAVRNLKHCKRYMISVMINEITELYYVSTKGKILLPIILKYLLSTHELIIYSAPYFFIHCDTRILKALLDGCIKSRVNLWTMWERNLILNDSVFCPVTVAYFTERLDFLRVLLNYGFLQTDHKVSTVKFLKIEHEMFDGFPWPEEIISKFSQKPRSTVVLEVFIFIEIYLRYSESPPVHAKCFQLAWDARMDPCVTKQELLSEFEDYIRLCTTLYDRNEVNTLRTSFIRRLDEFRTLLPDYQMLIPQPRSLQHLCRCTVREALYNNMQMPRGVAKLPIPKKMKSYILLK